MYAVGVNRHGHVHPVVDQEGHPAACQGSLETQAQGDEFPGVDFLFAQLDQGDPALDGLQDDFFQVTSQGQSPVSHQIQCKVFPSHSLMLLV